MRVLDLFSGIGGMSLGLESVGFRTVAFCELDPFCRLVLEHHWPGVPIHADVRTLRGSDVGAVDLVAGGFPCQPVSVAGKRQGQADARWLWPEMLRIVSELRPRWVLAENVPGLRTLGADRVLEDLESAGYSCWPLVVGACHVGAPHKRLRVWIVGRRVRAGSERRHEDACFGRGLDAALGVELAQADQRLCDPQGAGRRSIPSIGESRDQAGMANGLDPSRSYRGEGWGRGRPHQPEQAGQPSLESSHRDAQGELPEPRQPLLPETDLAHGDSAGRCTERSGGLLDGERPSPRDHADGCGERPVGEPTGPRLEGQRADAGEPQEPEPRHASMADASWHGRGGQEREAGCGRGVAPASAAIFWPARPGEPQHPWEEPRLVAHSESRRNERPSEPAGAQLQPDSRNSARKSRGAQQPLGLPASGLPERLVRRANREALKALGNAVVPQVVAEIGRAILAAESEAMTQERAA